MGSMPAVIQLQSGRTENGSLEINPFTIDDIIIARHLSNKFPYDPVRERPCIGEGSGYDYSGCWWEFDPAIGGSSPLPPSLVGSAVFVLDPIFYLHFS